MILKSSNSSSWNIQLKLTYFSILKAGKENYDVDFVQEGINIKSYWTITWHRITWLTWRNSPIDNERSWFTPISRINQKFHTTNFKTDIWGLYLDGIQAWRARVEHFWYSNKKRQNMCDLISTNIWLKYPDVSWSWSFLLPVKSTRTVDSKCVLVLSNWAPRVALETLQVQTFG